MSILFSQLLCNLVTLRIALAAGYLDPGMSDSIESFLKGMPLGQELLLFDQVLLMSILVFNGGDVLVLPVVGTTLVYYGRRSRGTTLRSSLFLRVKTNLEATTGSSRGWISFQRPQKTEGARWTTQAPRVSG